MSNDTPTKPKSRTRQTTPHKQAFFSSVADVQAFIVWARQQGLKRAKIGDVEFEIADLTVALDSEAAAIKGTEERDTTRTMTDTLTPDAKQEDEDLFWSSN